MGTRHFVVSGGGGGILRHKVIRNGNKTIFHNLYLIAPFLCQLGPGPLPIKIMFAFFSKMIINEELSATLDEPTDCLIMHRVEPSRLQLLALHLTDKLQTLAEMNEQVKYTVNLLPKYLFTVGNEIRTPFKRYF